jgi:hypothetical protein
MKNYILLVSIFAVLIFFESCDFNKKENTEKLFVTEMHNYKIEFEEDISVDNLLDTLLFKYCDKKEVRQLPYLLFDRGLGEFTTKKSKNTIKIGIEPPLCFPAEFDFSKILEILKDHNNFEVEGEVVNNDEIDKYVFEHYIDFDSEDVLLNIAEKGIWLITSDVENVSDVEIVFPKIIDGFIMVADFAAEKVYGKSYNELSEDEVLFLDKYLVFRLSFKHYEAEPQVQITSQ